MFGIFRMIVFVGFVVIGKCDEKSGGNEYETSQAELKSLHSYYKYHEERLSQQESLAERLQERLDHQEAVNEWLKERLRSQEETIHRLESMLASAVPRDEDGFVGFTVYQSEPRNYSAGDNIEFDSVISNYGSFFNTSSSEFKCPVDGYYLFLGTVMNANEYGAEMDITVGESRVAISYARDKSIFHQGTSAAVMYCSAGQVVWAKNRQDGDGIHGFPDFPYTAFSGVLLRRLPQA